MINSFPTHPGSHPHSVGGCRCRILVAVLFLTNCGGCQDGSPVTTLQVRVPPTLEIAPKGVSLVVGDSLRFTATVKGPLEGPPGDVTWLASGGLINQTGLFRAGDETGTYEVRAELQTTVGVLRDTTAGPINPREQVDDEVEPEPGVLFQDDFESNHFGRWSGLAPAADPQWDGGGDGSGGAHIGDGYITNEQSHTGQFAWKALLDPAEDSYGKANKSSLERWKGMAGISEFYISAWYFIPTDYPPVSSLIMQMKSGGSGSSYQPVAFYIGRDRTFSIYSQILDKALLKTAVKFPVGRWFNLTGRFVVANEGLVEAWLDGQKVASVQTDTKDNDYAYPGVGNYVLLSDWPVKCHIYIDDVKVTTAPP